VVLFDEIEKGASRRVHILLQIHGTEDSRCQGTVLISARGIIMTSNVEPRTSVKGKGLGFSAPDMEAAVDWTRPGQFSMR
jgi:ATP-dependent Clp protease ATP-binding subunit ClpA